MVTLWNNTFYIDLTLHFTLMQRDAEYIDNWSNNVMYFMFT